MSVNSELNPTFGTIASVHGSILGVLKSDLPPGTAVDVIGSLLPTINLWANQIPIMLDGPGTSPSANLVFAIRKDLFRSPDFSLSFNGIPIAELPSAYQEFNSFLHKLMDAQQSGKEKPASKVSLIISFYKVVAKFIDLACSY